MSTRGEIRVTSGRHRAYVALWTDGRPDNARRAASKANTRVIRNVGNPGVEEVAKWISSEFVGQSEVGRESFFGKNGLGAGEGKVHEIHRDYAFHVSIVQQDPAGDGLPPPNAYRLVFEED